jgi:hypothetical protein
MKMSKKQKGEARMSRYCRRPKTKNQIGIEGAIASDIKVGDLPYMKVIGKRNIPTNWDDIRIAAQYDKTWKRFRKTKYKENKTCN